MELSEYHALYGSPDWYVLVSLAMDELDTRMEPWGSEWKRSAYWIELEKIYAWFEITWEQYDAELERRLDIKARL